MTLQEFIAEYDITLGVDRIPERTDDVSDFGPDARHWCVTLRSGNGAAMSLEFSQGNAHTKPPTAEAVLDCLATDIASVENADGFEGWAADLGYDDDSRRAEHIYEHIKVQRAQLFAALGEVAFHKLFETECL